MKFTTNVLIAIAILINYSSARPTRSLGENNDDAPIFPLNIRVLNEDGLKYGNVFSVECTADSADITDIKWIRESFKNRAYFSSYENTILMTINGIIPMDFGKYTCVAIRADGIQVKKSIRIERNPNFGNRFRYRIDDEKKSSSDGSETLNPGKLLANEESLSHNLIGSISDQTDVRIQQDFQTYTHEGETVTFTCLINDEDRADVAWTRNHGFMPRNHRVINNTLILFNITSSDTGYYICSYGDKSTYVYLGLVRRDFPITYVKIPSKAKQINVVEGDSVEMDCIVVGELPTNLRWEKHQNKLPENHFIENNKLKLTNVQIENYGYYECLGENALGNFSDFVYLDVKNKTELLARHKTTTAAREENEESTTEALETTTVTNESDTEVENSNEEADESEVDTSSDPEPQETSSSNESNDGEITNETEGANEIIESEQNDQLTTTPAAVTEQNEETISSTEASSVEVTSTEVAPTDPVPKEEEIQQTQSVEPETSTEASPVATTTPVVEVTETVAQEVNQPTETEAVQTTTPVVSEEVASSTEAPAEGSSDGDVSFQETATEEAKEEVAE